MITEGKKKSLEKKMSNLGIYESDLVEKFVKGSGKGGQKINKSSTCVYLKHNPTGHDVKCQRTRSLQDNRYFARRMLCEKIEGEIFKEKSEKQQQIQKIKRQKRKRSKRAKEKMLGEKKIQSDKKNWRKKPSFDGND